PGVAHVVLDLGDAAEPPPRVRACIRCARGALVLLSHREMKRDVVLEVLFALSSRHERLNAKTQTSQPLGHRCLSVVVSGFSRTSRRFEHAIDRDAGAPPG